MSSMTETRSTRIVKSEVVAEFSPEALAAPFFLRVGAFIIDYILFILVPVMILLVGRGYGIDGVKLLAGEFNDIGWLIAILIGISNSLILPLFTGQSIGKMLTGLRIVSNDGNPASVKSILLRNTFGYLLTIASCGIGFIFSVFSSKSRALHDYIAGSMVIHGRKRTLN